jgi:hypothetical protein
MNPDRETESLCHVGGCRPGSIHLADRDSFAHGHVTCSMGHFHAHARYRYIAELGLWLGWGVFFGSPAVFAGCVLLALPVNLVNGTGIR